MSSPLNMVKALLDESIIVKLRNNRELYGTLHAYDEHCNLVLGDVEERVYYLVENDIQYKSNHSDMLFVRGDSVILIRR